MADKQPTTKLLVSVRSAAEAQAALEGGADLIDVKEPLRGSLGGADPQTVRTILRQIAGRVPVSVALGELLDSQLSQDMVAAAEGAQFAKLGLAGCATTSHWPELWHAALARFPREVAPVAVAYADWKSAASPELEHVLSQASTYHCKAVLLDTFSKAHGSLVDHMSADEVRRFIAGARQRRLIGVVAGSLGPREIVDLLPLAPDYIAVRSAVCIGGRTSQLDPARVERLAGLVHKGIACGRLG